MFELHGLGNIPREVIIQENISAILPLINAPVHTLDTQYHCMEIVEKTT